MLRNRSQPDTADIVDMVHLALLTKVVNAKAGPTLQEMRGKKIRKKEKLGFRTELKVYSAQSDTKKA